ncbi:MAG: hypothetical protein EZS28_002309 [Streblomastix strix]|uniref:Uncharacterized protein n=1 Tax=Streblomastix strix TaxID=222440 RepID=A0A5J4X4P5_9EUKA|nr:MAG: hypothetical protein EZS28_002309 [Streblomastix strix]
MKQDYPLQILFLGNLLKMTLLKLLQRLEINLKAKVHWVDGGIVNFFLEIQVNIMDFTLGVENGFHQNNLNKENLDQMMKKM